MDTRRRHRLLVALPLLMLQAVAGGAVALAHANETVPAGSAIEASHDTRCPVVHDPLRCALCHYAAARVATQRPAVVIPGRPARAAVPLVDRVRIVAPVEDFSAPPRAPPLALS